MSLTQLPKKNETHGGTGGSVNKGSPPDDRPPR